METVSDDPLEEWLGRALLTNAEPREQAERLIEAYITPESQREAIIDLFYGVNQSVGSIKFVDDFHAQLGGLVEQSRALHAEVASTDRYKAAAAKAATTRAG